jgi:hypothetical protein
MKQQRCSLFTLTSGHDNRPSLVYTAEQVTSIRLASIHTPVRIPGMFTFYYSLNPMQSQLLPVFTFSFLLTDAGVDSA